MDKLFTRFTIFVQFRRRKLTSIITRRKNNPLAFSLWNQWTITMFFPSLTTIVLKLRTLGANQNKNRPSFCYCFCIGCSPGQENECSPMVSCPIHAMEYSSSWRGERPMWDFLFHFIKETQTVVLEATQLSGEILRKKNENKTTLSLSQS